MRLAEGVQAVGFRQRPSCPFCHRSGGVRSRRPVQNCLDILAHQCCSIPRRRVGKKLRAIGLLTLQDLLALLTLQFFLLPPRFLCELLFPLYEPFAMANQPLAIQPFPGNNQADCHFGKLLFERMGSRIHPRDRYLRRWLVPRQLELQDLWLL